MAAFIGNMTTTIASSSSPVRTGRRFSSTLPNLFETTGLGVGFGTLYTREPQFRVGAEHNFGNFKIGPEFAIVLPAFGNIP